MGSVSDGACQASPPLLPSTAYMANMLNQYTAFGTTAFTYNDNGNLTGDSTYTHGFDVQNRLIAVRQGGSNLVTYSYDPEGRRASRIVGGSTTRLPLRDGSRDRGICRIVLSHFGDQAAHHAGACPFAARMA
jgi:YD repeat-containing protein